MDLNIDSCFFPRFHDDRYEPTCHENKRVIVHTYIFLLVAFITARKKKDNDSHFVKMQIGVALVTC